MISFFYTLRYLKVYPISMTDMMTIFMLFIRLRTNNY